MTCPRTIRLVKTLCVDQTESQPKTGDIRVDNPLLDDRIRSAINDALSKKGYRETSQETPDFYVVYTYQIRSKIESNNVTVGLGFGGGSVGSFGAVGIDSGGNAREYDEGLLVIDLNDASKESLLWRGMGTTPINQHTDPEENVKEINAWVEKILSQFPPQALIVYTGLMTYSKTTPRFITSAPGDVIIYLEIFYPSRTPGPLPCPPCGGCGSPGF
jgi:hypothetical protein